MKQDTSLATLTGLSLRPRSFSTHYRGCHLFTSKFCEMAMIKLSLSRHKCEIMHDIQITLGPVWDIILPVLCCVWTCFKPMAARTYSLQNKQQNGLCLSAIL